MKQSRFASLPFRLGTTSYIIEDDILPNVRYLADQVDDIELVLFELDDFNNLPTAETLQVLSHIGKEHRLSYTVHLPLDLAFDDQGKADSSFQKIRAIMETTAVIDPHAWILHLDSRSFSAAIAPDQLSAWTENHIRALHKITAGLSEPKLLAVENLESYPAEWNHPVIEAAGVSECIDIGHLMLQQRDPVQYLEERLDFARVIHWHGIGSRDHQSLRHSDQTAVREILNVLKRHSYRHPVTLEIFSRSDFESSLDWIEGALRL